jgi:hypothetical protein
LETLCRLALGDTVVQQSLAVSEERTARNAVARGDFRSAVFYARRAVQLAPTALPLQKLYLLTLYGAGQWADAASLRHYLRQVAPGDSDLQRWQLPELDSLKLDSLTLTQAGYSKKETPSPRSGKGASSGWVLGLVGSATVIFLLFAPKFFSKQGESVE